MRSDQTKCSPSLRKLEKMKERFEKLQSKVFVYLTVHELSQLSVDGVARYRIVKFHHIK